MTTLPHNYELEKATKAESVVLSKRGRRYLTLLSAVVGVLEVVNPSNGHLWNAGKGLLSIFGVQF